MFLAMPSWCAFLLPAPDRRLGLQRILGVFEKFKSIELLPAGLHSWVESLLEIWFASVHRLVCTPHLFPSLFFICFRLHLCLPRMGRKHRYTRQSQMGIDKPTEPSYVVIYFVTLITVMLSHIFLLSFRL